MNYFNRPFPVTFTTPSIVHEIASKSKKFPDINRRSFWLCHCSHTSAMNESLTHSLRIEDPHFYNGDGTRRQSRSVEKAHYDNLIDAFYWGRNNFRPLHFSENFIKSLAGRIDSEFHKGVNAKYREGMESVRPEHATWTPPYPEKIPKEMDEFTNFLKKHFNPLDIGSVIDCSSYAHLHLVRIHPFKDTNGRTARLLQNVLLDYVRLPPPTIFEGERQGYFRILQDAIHGWRERTGNKERRPSNAERVFYDYMAGKVSAVLDRAIDDFRKDRHY